jgi:His-Xaa-Ser system protein HxsD
VTEKDPGTETSAVLVFRDGAIQAEIDLGVYRLTAVQKSAYRLAERCTAVLGTRVVNRLPITFTFRPETREQDALEAVRLFFQDLLDQELREKIGDETRAIRALLIAQAFSRTDLIQHD